MWKTFLITLFLCSNAFGFFGSTHPSDGVFKFQHPSKDPWYYIGSDWMLQTPDKWQHYMMNYISGRFLPKKLGTTKTITICMILNIWKELDDAYREGFSTRDFTVNCLGLSAGVMKLPVICDYNVKQQRILLRCYIKF